MAEQQQLNRWSTVPCPITVTKLSLNFPVVSAITENQLNHVHLTKLSHICRATSLQKIVEFQSQKGPGVDLFTKKIKKLRKKRGDLSQSRLLIGSTNGTEPRFSNKFSSLSPLFHTTHHDGQPRCFCPFSSSLTPARQVFQTSTSSQLVVSTIEDVTLFPEKFQQMVLNTRLMLVILAAL